MPIAYLYLVLSRVTHENINVGSSSGSSLALTELRLLVSSCFLHAASIYATNTRTVISIPAVNRHAYY